MHYRVTVTASALGGTTVAEHIVDAKTRASAIACIAAQFIEARKATPAELIAFGAEGGKVIVAHAEAGE
jgi:imidazole glycerol phosphate synthase subunit HisF